MGIWFRECAWILRQRQHRFTGQLKRIQQPTGISCSRKLATGRVGPIGGFSELPSPRLLSLAWQPYFSLAIAVCPPVCGHPARLPRPTLSYQSLRASLRRALPCCHLKIGTTKKRTLILRTALRTRFSPAYPTLRI